MTANIGLDVIFFFIVTAQVLYLSDHWLDSAFFFFLCVSTLLLANN